MYRFVTAAVGLAMMTGAAMAQTTGVATCDDFLTKYDACITSKVPAAQQATFKTQFEQMKSSWAEMAKTPQGKAQLEPVCKSQMDQMKQVMQPQGCSF